LITPPTDLPISLAEAKAYLRAIDDDEDATVVAMIRAATNLLDARGFLGRCLMAQTWEWSDDAFPAGAICLPLGPVTSVASVVYDDLDGVEQTVSSSNYDVSGADFGGRIVRRADFSWPATKDKPDAVRVQFVAGAASWNDTPEGVRQALLAMVAMAFDGRGCGPMLTPGIMSDLAPYRRPVLV